MYNSIQNSPFEHPSSWRDEWWCSVWPNHLDIQEQRTTWIFLYLNSQTPTVNYYLWKNCISYKTSLLVHECIIKEWQTSITNCAHDDISHHISWQQRKIGCLHRWKLFMDSIVILELFQPELYLTLQVKSLIILVLHIPKILIKQLSILLLISTFILK